ncbi:unnamed protein product, partial [Ectocarpus fasciculatus]
PLQGGCFSPKLPLEDVAEGVVSGPGEAQRRLGGRAGSAWQQRKSWKTRLRGDLVTCREPSEAFAFVGQQRGKQDVLMEVVASNPPVIAITCTTELSLFSLDGKRLPAVSAVPQHRWKKQRQRRWQYVEGARQERDSSSFDASAAVGAVDVGGGGGAAAAASSVNGGAGAAGTASAAGAIDTAAAASFGGGETESSGASYKRQREKAFTAGEGVYERDGDSADDDEEE